MKITAKQFGGGEYSAKIKQGNCEVITQHGNHVINILLNDPVETALPFTVFCKEYSFKCDDFELFSVVDLPSLNQYERLEIRLGEYGNKTK